MEHERRGARRRSRRLLTVLVLVGVVLALRPPLAAAMRVADRKAALRLVELEAKLLYSALGLYAQRTGSFPESAGALGLREDTLEPLRRRGYYRRSLLAWLADGRIDAYDAPDDRGPNQEFWLELTLANDPGVRLLVARSDDAPLGGGEWRDGVYVWSHGRLVRRSP